MFSCLLLLLHTALTDCVFSAGGAALLRGVSCRRVFSTQLMVVNLNEMRHGSTAGWAGSGCLFVGAGTV